MDGVEVLGLMARRDLISQSAFNSGELGPLMVSRQDQARYGYGLRRMRNFIPALQGPARKRPGFRFVCEVADSSERAWAVPFVTIPDTGCESGECAWRMRARVYAPHWRSASPIRRTQP